MITVVLAATAIPVELRPLGSEPISFGIGVADVLANVAGYLPVGIALGELGLARAIITAGLISTFAESIQFGLMLRTRDSRQGRPVAVTTALKVLSRRGDCISAHDYDGNSA